MAKKDGEQMTKIPVHYKVMNSMVPFINDEDLPIIWVNDIDIDSAQMFIRQLIQYDSDPNVSEIYVYISSYGGEVFAGLAMIEAMQACSKPVNTVCMGICASAGADLLICGTGKRWMSENSFIHIHHTRSRITDDLPGIDKTIKQMRQVEDKIFKLIISKSKISPSEMRDKLKDEQKEWQMTAQVAQKNGFIDIVGLPKFRRYTVVEGAEK
jgi:ATP-dependent Clp protease protease subunit